MSRAGLLTSLAAIILLSACATPETRVRGGLMNAGLSEPVSRCMAGRMVDRLSVGQLKRLGRLGKLQNRKPGDVAFDEFAKRTKALQDPEIIGVVTSSGLICALK